MRATSLPLIAVVLLIGLLQGIAWGQWPSVPPGGVGEPPLLVVLTDTGRKCGDLPVLTRHPDASRHRAVLERGFSGRLLRWFRWEQQYLNRRDGRGIEPAYLLLSTTQGGFPRFGFCLDEAVKPDVAYVDLHRDGDLEGRFGAMDQIFPHELLHVVLHQLAGESPAGGANQVHALGVRTDPFVAFNEGFAEHAQVAAVDDPDATPATAALAGDPAPLARTGQRLREYVRALSARWAPAPRARLGFLLWYNQAEQTLRYHGVKQNWYAREPVLPDRLLHPGDPYAAYLLEGTLPGETEGPFRSPSRLRAIEAVTATTMVGLVTATAELDHRQGRAFYEAFGAAPEAVDPRANAYLKIFTVFAEDRAMDLWSFLTAYVRRFPEDAAAVLEVARRSGLDLDVAPAAEIWLANAAFSTGTTLFDQFRGVPRRHTFDLNAASLVDLLGVPGVDRRLAEAILRGGPYQGLDDLRRVGVTPDLLARFHEMAADMQRQRAGDMEDDASLNLTAIVMPGVWRALGWLVVGWLTAALAYASVRRLRPARLAANGLAASLVGLGVAWVFGPPWWVVVTVPIVAFGTPAVIWHLARRRGGAVRVAAAWAAASLPALLLTTPLS